MRRLAFVSLCLVLAACSSTESSDDHPAPPFDASTDTAFGDGYDEDSSVADVSPEVAPAADAPAADAPVDDGTADSEPSEAASNEAGSTFETCVDACAQTELMLTFDGQDAPLDRAQFGFNAPSEGTLHVEAHFGGDADCPTPSSPTPDRTVIFANVPIPLDSTPIEGTPVTLLDFEGSVSPNPFDKATHITLTPVAAKTAPAEEAFVAFDVSVTFPDGTLNGHVYAVHCDSMDE